MKRITNEEIEQAIRDVGYTLNHAGIYYSKTTKDSWKLIKDILRDLESKNDLND